MKKSRNKNINLKQIIITLIIMVLLIGLEYIKKETYYNYENINTVENYNSIVDIPEYTGQIYVELNNNIPHYCLYGYSPKDLIKLKIEEKNKDTENKPIQNIIKVDFKNKSYNY